MLEQLLLHAFDSNGVYRSLNEHIQSNFLEKSLRRLKKEKESRDTCWKVRNEKYQISMHVYCFVSLRKKYVRYEMFGNSSVQQDLIDVENVTGIKYSVNVYRGLIWQFSETWQLVIYVLLSNTETFIAFSDETHIILPHCMYFQIFIDAETNIVLADNVQKKRSRYLLDEYCYIKYQ